MMKVVRTRRPDSTYGMDRPYEFVTVNDEVTFEKFPFSPFTASIAGKVSCRIHECNSTFFRVVLDDWGKANAYPSKASQTFPFGENREEALSTACKWAYEQMKGWS
jgi:hypothetical protein